MLLSRRVLIIMSTVLITIVSFAQEASHHTAAPTEEPALSNKDVIKLVKLQLGDDVVMAKIKQAQDLAFDLSTDGLVQLKQAGVSSKVITAMLEKTTPTTATVAAPSVLPAHRDDRREGVGILINGKEIHLPSSRGDLSATGFWPVVFTFLDYPGLRARTRTTDWRPTLVIRSGHDPRGYYYLARLDVNHEEENNRSLKIEQKASGFTETTRVIPADRWFVEYDRSEKAAGVWHIQSMKDLEPGEYGVVVPGGVLYEFGID